MKIVNKANKNGEIFVANPTDVMLDKASKQMEEVMQFYQIMLFEGDVCELRTLAGYIAMSLSDAVAYANQTYFNRGLKKQIEDLKSMKSTPEDFVLPTSFFDYYLGTKI